MKLPRIPKGLKKRLARAERNAAWAKKKADRKKEIEKMKARLQKLKSK